MTFKSEHHREPLCSTSHSCIESEQPRETWTACLRVPRACLWTLHMGVDPARASEAAHSTRAQHSTFPAQDSLEDRSQSHGMRSTSCIWLDETREYVRALCRGAHNTIGHCFGSHATQSGMALHGNGCVTFIPTVIVGIKGREYVSLQHISIHSRHDAFAPPRIAARHKPDPVNKWPQRDQEASISLVPNSIWRTCCHVPGPILTGNVLPQGRRGDLRRLDLSAIGRLDRCTSLHGLCAACTHPLTCCWPTGVNCCAARTCVNATNQPRSAALCCLDVL